MAPVAVVVMAREPLPGTVKTRLRPSLPDDDIAALYEAFLRDRVEQVRSLRGVSPVIAYTPPEGGAFFAGLAPDFRLLPQAGDGLSARLINLVEQVLGAGHAGVIATDSDSPTLPTGHLQDAVDRLAADGADVVLGPSDDGGYYLVGLRRLYPELFDAMPWSTPQVYEETLRRAANLDLRVASLPPWYDVDTPAELRRLQAQIKELGAAAPRHTRHYFASRPALPCGSNSTYV